MTLFREQIALRKETVLSEIAALEEELDELRVAEAALARRVQKREGQLNGFAQQRSVIPREPDLTFVAQRAAPSVAHPQRSHESILQALVSRPRKKSHWEMVRSILEREPALETSTIVQRVLERYEVAIARESLSVQLSTWRNERKVKRDGNLWSLSEVLVAAI